MTPEVGSGSDGFWPSPNRIFPLAEENVYPNLRLAWGEGVILADSLDPLPPANVTAYSDFTTPNSMQVSWDDPTSLVNGDTLLPTQFTIEIARDGVPLASVAGGAGQFTDSGLTDGQLYSYDLYTKVTASDSTSETVTVSWYAGGSPVPSAPENLSCATTASEALLTWDDPLTQEDGTPLDDLDHLNVYRDGSLIASVAPGVQTYTDMPTPGFTYTYTVTAVDNEVPPNESDPSNPAECFVGTTPNILVWVGPDAVALSAASGDSIFDALIANGESAFLTNNLFEFGTDLSIYEAIFVVLGIFSNNHVLGAGDPEGPALETYLQGGGRLYLEGGDCFYFDPLFGGYNINPWFDVTPLGDGSADVFGVIGLNDLSAFTFAYNGENNWMDELAPISSTAIWQNSQNSDIHGIFNVGGGAAGAGRAIGVVPSFGGMVDSPSPVSAVKRIVKDFFNKEVQQPVAKVRPQREGRREKFVKRAAYYPELKTRIKRDNPLYKITPHGIEMLAN
ncbi:MAG: hypothetical protein ACE5GO_12650, partial [Anaerolineales bacterium]